MSETTVWVDFKAVKAQVTMQMLIDHYGLTLKKSGEELRGKCPICKVENKRSFTVSLSKGAFNAFCCKARGNVLDLTAVIEQCSIRDAALKLADWFEVETGEPPDDYQSGVKRQTNKTNTSNQPRQPAAYQEREQGREDLSYAAAGQTILVLTIDDSGTAEEQAQQLLDAHPWIISASVAQPVERNA